MLNELPKFCLITGAECSLCTVAEDLISATVPDLEMGLIDVRSDHTLYHLYGAQIPVLLNTHANMALYWPFTATSISEFMHS